MNKPIVWTIAGSDSGGGAGIQADLHTFHSLGTYGCSVITALTAQNSYEVRHIEYASPAIITDQITVLAADLKPQAIKLGMLGTREVMQAVLHAIEHLAIPIICDPVMISSSGALLLESEALTFFIKHIIPRATVLTPNLYEAAALAGMQITDHHSIKKVAQKLLMLGVSNVLIKGGHGEGKFSQDYWANGSEAFWLSTDRIAHHHNHGSGCSLAAAITACLALGHSLKDSLVIAKAYVRQGIRAATAYGQGPGPVAHLGWPEHGDDFPCVTQEYSTNLTPSFSDCSPEPLGFYPIVDNSKWIAKLLPLGIKTIQLRIKNLSGNLLKQEIQRAVALAQQYQARLFINDYWELALQHGAYGVHLGQEDLAAADCQALARARLRLGISTHNYWEVARALAYKPSYIAIGPIFHTTSKAMSHKPQGISQLKQWRRIFPNYPLVAIGGINKQNLSEILATGVDGIAVISAITQAIEPLKEAKEWLAALNTRYQKQ